MDTIKVFAKTFLKLETPVQTIRIYRLDIGMEFGIDKYAILIMNSGKRESTEGIGLPNQECIKTLGEKESDKYLRILQADTIKQAEIKEK